MNWNEKTFQDTFQFTLVASFYLPFTIEINRIVDGKRTDWLRCCLGLTVWGSQLTFSEVPLADMALQQQGRTLEVSQGKCVKSGDKTANLAILYKTTGCPEVPQDFDTPTFFWHGLRYQAHIWCVQSTDENVFLHV